MEEQGAIRLISGRKSIDSQEYASRQHRRRGRQSKRFCAMCECTGCAAFEYDDSVTDKENNQRWNCGKEGHEQRERPNYEKASHWAPMGDKRKGEYHSHTPRWVVPSTLQVHWLIDAGCPGHHISPQCTPLRNDRQVMRRPVGTPGKEDYVLEGRKLSMD